MFPNTHACPCPVLYPFFHSRFPSWLFGALSMPPAYPYEGAIPFTPFYFPDLINTFCCSSLSPICPPNLSLSVPILIPHPFPPICQPSVHISILHATSCQFLTLGPICPQPLSSICPIFVTYLPLTQIPLSLSLPPALLPHESYVCPPVSPLLATLTQLAVFSCPSSSFCCRVSPRPPGAPNCCTMAWLCLNCSLGTRCCMHRR